jgi:uncharacterized membrane protein HdeD (DUF308 family)
MDRFDLAERETVAQAARYWWLFLFTGIIWFLVSIIILRFDYTSVTAISILFGVIVMFFGVNELFAIFATHGWWRVLHAALGVIFVALGFVAFIHPGNTFAALAAVISFFFIFKGFFDIIVSIATKNESSVWWLQLTVGIVEVAIGFWAAGYYGRSAVLLVVWVGISALVRGITEIIFAFKLRSAGHAIGRGDVAVA